MTAPLDLAALLAQLTGLPLDRARALLDRAPLQMLAKESPEGLESLYELTKRQAGALYAGLRLGRLTCRGIEGTDVPLNTPRVLAEYLIPQYGHSPVEQFGIVLLNTKHRLIGVRIVTTGSLDTCIVHPREVFKLAINARASCIVLFHNHPSGDPTPSTDDLLLTTRLVGSGSILGIDVLDHLILSESKYFSLVEAGRMERTGS